MVMLRCIIRYRMACERSRSVDFWTQIAPAALREVQTEVKESTNFLANFLTNGDEDYQILQIEGKTTPFTALDKAFSNHMKKHHNDSKAKIQNSGGKYPITAAGYTIKQLQICKLCKKISSVANCGQHYDSKNRTKRLEILKMQIMCAL